MIINEICYNDIHNSKLHSREAWLQIVLQLDTSQDDIYILS